MVRNTRGQVEKDFWKPEIILGQSGKHLSRQRREYGCFVEGKNDSPVNWALVEKRPASIIGDTKFMQRVVSKLKRVRKRKKVRRY